MGKEEKELFFTRDRSLSIFYSAKSLKRKEESEAQGYAIRVLSGNGLGFSYADSESELDKAEETARQLAKYSPRQNFRFPEAHKCKQLNRKDSKIENMTIKDLKEIFELVKDGAEKHGGNAQIVIETNCDETKIENSNGFSGSYNSAAIQIMIEVMDKDGFGFFSNSFPKLPKEKDFYKMGEEAAEMARDSRNPGKIESGKYIVAFEPDALGSLLDILLPSFNGEMKKRKISYLHDKLGKQVFNEQLSIYDDPLHVDGVNSQPFDDEGVPSARIPLVENGVVKNCIYNLEIASLEGIADCGRCARPSYANIPGIGFSNLIISPGNMGEDDGELSVLSFHGTHTANVTTGDFGIEVNSAFLLKNNKRMPVRGFMISGNIFNLFNTIYGIGKRQKKLGSFFSPRIAFSDVHVI